jgi:peroxisomal 3,2-trans-enoyl-CoA isomerase
VAEGGSSRALVTRLGPARANEALIMSKRILSAELERCGFVNKVFEEVKQGEDDKFRELVLKEVDERLGDHLVGDSLLGIKKLIKGPEQNLVNLNNFNEVFAGLERFMTGVPQEEFRKLGSGEKRHKL